MTLPNGALYHPSPDEDVIRVTEIIQAQSLDAQLRIAVIAQILRDLLARDTTDESLLAFTLVMSEIARD